MVSGSLKNNMLLERYCQCKAIQILNMIFWPKLPKMAIVHLYFFLFRHSISQLPFTIIAVLVIEFLYTVSVTGAPILFKVVGFSRTMTLNFDGANYDFLKLYESKVWNKKRPTSKNWPLVKIHIFWQILMKLGETD